ncbi:MAG: NmrA/HSCARG family protein [Deltaproteobacteria bacterium]|nr:NmrA/HSCARG family protein [Deltaproteobacteria bacterium]
MANQRTILITGATGKQGGAVCRALIGSDFRLRALTRKPDGEPAKALAKAGVELVAGDLNDAVSIRTALDGAWGTFAVQNTWEAGVEREEEQGHRFARVAREAGVQHFVYSSVGSAERGTGIPHFDNKYRVEGTVRSLGFPSHVILRPVFFMENLTSPWFLRDGKLLAALAPETRLQMVAVSDIGRVGARAFVDAARMRGREIEIAGDTATMPQVAAALTEARHTKVPFERIPIEAVRAQSGDMATMLEWFDHVGYGADIPALDREFGPMTRLWDWLRTQPVG